MLLTRRQKRQLADEGCLVLRAAVPQALIAAARRSINGLLGTKLGHAEPNTSLDQEALSGYHSQYWAEIRSSPALMDLLFRSPLWSAAEQLLGRGAVERPDRAQIALRFPEYGGRRYETDFHVDSVELPSGDLLEEIRQSSFTMQLGVLLSDLTREDCGNFVVRPGSHRVIAEHFRRHGVRSLREGMPPGLRLAAPRQFTGRAGDAILCHYQTAHDRVPNLSPDIRYMVFFRLKRVGHAQEAERALTDVFREWPGLEAVK